MMIPTHQASYKSQGLIKNSYKVFKKRLNTIKSPEDWIKGYEMALKEMNKDFRLSKKRIEKAKSLGYRYFLCQNNKSRCRYVIGITAMFIVMRLDGEVVTIKNFAQKSKVSKISITRCLRDMVEKLDLSGECGED